MEAESHSPQSVINKKPSEFYMSCVEDSILLVANAEMEKVIFQKFPRFETLCRILSEELLAKNRTEFDEFKIFSPEQRYLNLLPNRPDLLNLSATEFADKIKELPTATIIDVRTHDEFSKGHLLNAINYDWNRNDFDKQIALLDKKKPVFVYCLSGSRSASAANFMRSVGFK